MSTVSDNNSLDRGSSTPRPSTPNKAKAVYRTSFAAMNMRITEGFLQHHPGLPDAITKLLTPSPCVSEVIKSQVWARLRCSNIQFPEMENMDAAYFYAERPENVHPRQEEVAEYLFLHRPKEMHFQDPSGRTEAKWSDCTKHNLFLPLLDPKNEMNTLYSIQSCFH